jgi:hypothetical protein
MKALIDEAKQYIQQDIKSKKDVFIKLCSLNFLNSMIKDKEYKKELSYAYIKPCVSKLVNFLVSKFENRNTDELYYDAQTQCMYIRCYGIQFSFHNIIVTESINTFVNSNLNIPVKWDGIRLQPISKKLFLLAIDVHSGKTEVNQIKEAFEQIVEGN